MVAGYKQTTPAMTTPMKECGMSPLERKSRELDSLIDRLRMLGNSFSDALVELENFNDRLCGPVPRDCGPGSNECSPVPSSCTGNLSDAIDSLERRIQRLHREVERSSSVA